MHQKSAGDICLNLEGYLCVLTFTSGKPEGALKEELIKLSKNYAQKALRGSSFKFMWVDIEKESHWKNAFSIEKVPSMLVLNPGRRKRYVIHENAITFSDVVNTVEKINSGDTRFIGLKVMPDFITRQWK